MVTGSAEHWAHPDFLCSAGNAVVVKPSEVSENMANLLATIIPQYLDKVSCSPRHKENCVGARSLGLRDSDFLQHGAKAWVEVRTDGLSHWGEQIP